MNRNETKLIKGLAIILMLMHHLWGFPERIAGGGLNYLIDIFDQPIITYIGDFSKICVYIFMFVGGYGLFRSCEGKSSNILSRIKKLYFSYWKVFLIFIPIAFLFFRNQPIYCATENVCTRYKTFIWTEFIENLIGVSSSYNSEWWFFREYLIALITFPIIKSFIEKHSNGVNISFVVVLSICVNSVFPALTKFGDLSYNYIFTNFLCKNPPYIAAFWLGCALGKDDLLTRLRVSLKNNHLLSPIADVAIILAIVFLKNSGIRETITFLYIPFFLLANIDLINRCKPIKIVFEKIGEQSTNMWLVHTFYCYYFYYVVKAVTVTRYAVPSLIELIILSYISSVAIEKLWNFIKNATKKLVQL